MKFVGYAHIDIRIRRLLTGARIEIESMMGDLPPGYDASSRGRELKCDHHHKQIGLDGTPPHGGEN